MIKNENNNDNILMMIVTMLMRANRYSFTGQIMVTLALSLSST